MHNTYNAQDQPNKEPDTDPQERFLNQKLASFKYLLYCSDDMKKKKLLWFMNIKYFEGEDITKTAGYKEAMDDVKHGRVYHAGSVDDMFKQILG